MQEEVYRRLAQRLDALPNRFPASQSGIEIRLLAKLFTLPEATLACVMRLEAMPAADIASHAGTDPKETRDTLKRMVGKGLIDLKKGEAEFAYALRPFVVGFYEGQLPRMDAEMAELFEQYYRETRGGILRETPSLHRIIPVGAAIPLQVEIHPYERATELLEGAMRGGCATAFVASSRSFWAKVVITRSRPVLFLRLSRTLLTAAQWIAPSRKRKRYRSCARLKNRDWCIHRATIATALSISAIAARAVVESCAA